MADRSADLDLVLLFNKCANVSKHYGDQLKQWLIYSNSIDSFQLKSDSLSMFWYRIMDVFASDERNTLINQCENIERMAIKIHQTAIALSFIPHEEMPDAEKQMEYAEEVILKLKVLRQNSVQNLKVA
jgi:hypothetical protein